MEKRKPTVKKGDLIAIAGVLLLGVLGLLLFFLLHFWQANENSYCIVTHERAIIAVVPLQSALPESVVVNGDYHNEVVIENGQVQMAEANCPDKVCLHHTPIDTAGQSIVCLPNQVVVTISGTHPEGVDIVAG